MHYLYYYHVRTTPFSLIVGHGWDFPWSMAEELEL